MPLSTPQDLQQFKEIIAHWQTAYRFSDSALVAMKTGSDSTMLFGRIILYCDRPEQRQTFELNTEYLTAHRMVSSISEGEINQIISRAAQGQLHINGQTFSLKQEAHLGSVLFPVAHPQIGSGLRIPALRLYGARKDQFLQFPSFKPAENLDWQLKSADQPFDTFDELLIALGLPRVSQMGDLTSLEVVAGNPAMIRDNSRIHQGHANVVCRLANGLDIEKLKLGYKVQRGAVTDRSMIRGSNFQWTMTEDYREGTAQIAVGDAPVIQTFLSFDDVALHQWWIIDPDKRLNLRQAEYELFDQNLEILKTYLRGEGRDAARDFEKGVAFLCNLLGFAIVPLSVIQPLADGPDLIACTPNGHAAVIECTIGHLNENHKLAKLIRRTNLLKEKLQSSGHGHLTIQPVIVSLLTRAGVQAELAEAARYSVAVICKEELQTILNDMILVPNPEELFRRIPELIPRAAGTAGQASLFPVQ